MEGYAGDYSKVKSIEEDGYEDVYCINVPETGNFIANGIVVKNCDALRYACASAFPTGELSHPDEDIPYDRYRQNVFQEQEDLLGIGNGMGYL